MAGGEGGFSTKPMGFDRNEVNDYIAKINREMKELRAEKEQNDEKTRKAQKLADEAEAKIKAARADGEKKVSELELQLKTEKKNAENLIDQIDDLKRKLKAKGTSDAGSAKAAEKQAKEIVAKANATAADIVAKANAAAKDTVEKAKAAAKQMVESAGTAGAGGADPEAVNELLGIIGDFVSRVTSGANDLKTKANGLLKAEKSERQAVTVPDFTVIKAPQAEVPASAEASAPAKVSSPPQKASESPLDDIFAALEEDGTETADNDDLEMITEIQPLDDPSTAPGAVILEEFDLSQPMSIDELDEPVDEVKPINAKKRGAADLSAEFEKQILAQTANSSSLRAEMDDDMYAAVKQQEELFAVKPSDENIANFEMDAPADDVTTMDDLLKQAELAFGGASAGETSDKDDGAAEDTSSSKSGSGDNMWAELQNELWAMEKTGNLGGSDDGGNDAGMNSFDDPSTPDTDNSDIWDLGLGDDDNSGGDDDMSMGSDIFGNL